MSKSPEEIISKPSLVRERWLSPQWASREVVAFEREFGHKHLLFACHAALPLILTPELLNLIRINFLSNKRIPWVAEIDLPLSSLCRPIDEGIYTVEPRIREVLLVQLENLCGRDDAEQIKREIARFLLVYWVQKQDVILNSEIKQTQEWIARAYLDLNRVLLELHDTLIDSSLAEQIQVTKALEFLADPLEKSDLQEQYQDLITSSRILAHTFYGKEKISRSGFEKIKRELETQGNLLLSFIVEQLEASEAIDKEPQIPDIDIPDIDKEEPPPIQILETVTISYILHLSDFHFGTKQDANRWYGQLADDLRGLLYQLEPSQSPHLDALIVSGDIANKSTPQEYVAAEHFIHRLLPEFGLQRHQIAIVPGNHDLNWDLSKQAYEIKNRESYDGLLEEEKVLKKSIIVDGDYIHIPDETEYKQRFQFFSDFYENVMGKPYQLEYEQQYELRHFPEHDLLVLGLNSAWQVNHDENYRSRASINVDALNNALEEINQTPTYRDSKLKIAVWHHPLNSPYEDHIKDYGFMQRLAVNGFRLALHGHIHRAKVFDYNYDLSKWINIDIIAAGTFGAPVKKWVPGYPLQYNLLKWQDNTLTVYTRKRIEPNGAWQPDAMWLQDGGLTASSYYQIKLWDSGDSKKTANEAHHEPNKTISETLDKHYESVIKAIIRGRLVPFLGSDINLCDRPIQDNGELEPWNPDCPYPPSGQELATYLAVNFDDLTAAYLIDPREFYEKLQRLELSSQPNQLHKFFATLPAIMREKGYYPPYPLIVTTNYDRALEQAFEEAGESFDLVFYSSVIDAQVQDRFVHQTPDGNLQEILNPNEYQGLSFEERPVILKLYGSIDQIEQGQSLVITEENYIEYFVSREISNLLPVQLLKKIKFLQANILFLGYPIGDWYQRIILHRIWQNLTLRKRYGWWAIQSNPEPFAQKLWQSYDVVLFDVPLRDYISELDRRVRDIPAKGGQGYE